MSKKNVKKTLKNNILRCPRCGSKNTVGVVASFDNKQGNVSNCYYCCKCLIEFDNKYIKVFNKDGSSVKYIAI